MIGLFCVTNSWMMWVGLFSSSLMGIEKICRSLGRTSGEHEYRTRAWHAALRWLLEEWALLV